MNKINTQVEQLSKIIKKHEKYSYFSGYACVVAGVFWLVNEGLFFQLQFSGDYRVFSWIIVAMLSIIISASFTIYEGQKNGRDTITLSLLSIIDKLIVISFGTLAFLWIFYQQGMIAEMPGLLMMMYGILILTAKQNITAPIYIFGLINFIGGIIGLLFTSSSVLLSLIILGGGHVVLGIILIINGRKSL